MKSIYQLTSLLFVFFSFSTSFGAIITVNNNNPSPGQYSDLQLAIDAANAGDTLLIHRSPTSYGNVTLTKRLVLIGEGALPDKAPAGTSTLGNLTLTYNTTTLEHASKSKIIGLAITILYLYDKDATLLNAVDSISISYCKIIGGIIIKNKIINLKVNNTILFKVSGGSLFNCQFNKNLIYSFLAGNTQGQDNIFINNIIFQHLYFMGGIAANNIFYNPLTISFAFSCKNVVFSNNVLYAPSSTSDFSNLTSNGNSSVANQFNVDPMFVNPTPYNILLNYTYTVPANGPFANFHLQVGSPAIGAGTDGNELGLYGGSVPWKDGGIGDSRYRYYPLPNVVPIIKNIIIQNPVLNQGATLNIQINATTQP